MGWLDNLLRSAPPSTTLPSVAEPPHWPTADDVALSRQYDTSYGQQPSAWVQPQPPSPPPVVAPLRGPSAMKAGAPSIPSTTPASHYSGQLSQMPTKDATQLGFRVLGTLDMDPSSLPQFAPSPMADPLADRVTEAYLGARKSAISTLGFDPAHMTVGTAPASRFSRSSASRRRRR